MARNWIAKASRALFVIRSQPSRCPRRQAGLSVEGLEHRLSLSTVLPKKSLVPTDLKLQSVPPGYMTQINQHAIAAGGGNYTVRFYE